MKQPSIKKHSNKVAWNQQGLSTTLSGSNKKYFNPLVSIVLVPFSHDKFQQLLARKQIPSHNKRQNSFIFKYRFP
jgi:hypothetical protein